MNEETFWQEVLDVARISVSSANFNAWIRSTFIVSTKKVSHNKREKGQIIEVGCSSLFAKEKLEKRYSAILEDAVNQVTGAKNNLVFVVRQNPNTRQPEKPSPLFSQEKDFGAEILERAGIPNGFTFENFAVSPSNQLAFLAAESVSKKPGTLYNPLFLWGGVGVGKTHLAVATARVITYNFPDKKILYSTGDEFIVGIIEAIRTKTTSEFKNKYRKQNILIVDDIQFIAGKDTVQDEFFNTFNVINRAGGQLIMTSDKPPGEILRLEPRLRSRFEAGLIVDIEPPDFELRVAISLIKAKERGINLSQDAAQKIADSYSDARQIEGFINRLIAKNGHLQSTPNNFIEELLEKDMLIRSNGNINSVKRHRNNTKEIMQVICKHFGITQKQLIGKNRKWSLVVPRQIFMYFLRQELKLTLKDIGEITGGRDHTTIIHGVNKITNQLGIKKALYRDILGIKQKLWG